MQMVYAVHADGVRFLLFLGEQTLEVAVDLSRISGEFLKSKHIWDLGLTAEEFTGGSWKRLELCD